MKLNEIQYIRFNMDYEEKTLRSLFKVFEESKNFEKAHQTFLEINSIRDKIETTMNLVRIRFSQDTTDSYYDQENQYIDEVSPVYDGLIHSYYTVLVNTSYRHEFIALYGQQLFTLADLQLKTFNDSILELLKKENALCSAYQKLSGSAEFEYKNESMSMSQMGAFLSSDDRETRLESRKLVAEFYTKNEDNYDQIYHDLVQVRHEIACSLGYENYVQLGYDRYARSDYDASMVKDFREAVLEHIVPVAQALTERQKNRLDLESLSFIDEPLLFKSGNARPIGNPDWIIKKGYDVFSSFGETTKECYQKMDEGGLLDLVARKGKSGGGYCEYLNAYQMPFVFSNFNGTSGDIDILTHEFGHAFQVYQTKDFVIPEYHWATSEACEVHSTSMEYLTWPEMHHFFGDDAEKYRFTHLSTSVSFVPYICTVDEFQHFVYENPNVSPLERKTKWREIEKKFMPHKEYEDFEFYNRGGTFFRQSHIFTIPFYYIEYALAKVCAYQIWRDSRQDKKSTWERYYKLCQLGGQYSFLELLKRADIDSPFDPETLKNIIPEMVKYFDSVDDKNL